MKNISKRLYSVVRTALNNLHPNHLVLANLIFWVMMFGLIHGVPKQNRPMVRLEERRANYFLLPVPHSMTVKPGTTGKLFLEPTGKGTNRVGVKPVGSFRVLEIDEGKCLCQIVSIQPGIETLKIAFASWQEELPQPGYFVFDGKRYELLPLPVTGSGEQFFLSKQPLSLNRLETLTVSGFKTLLFQVEKETGKRFRADFIPYAQIDIMEIDRFIDFGKTDNIILGTRDGKLCMIYREYGHLLSTFMSKATLDKFKADLNLYIILKRY